jgi:protein-S-isoprenylcysteine O-methyltransferase Ste14
MPIYAYVLLLCGWIGWVLPFFWVQKQKQPAKKIDKRARWGIVLVGLAYGVLWQGRFWEHSPNYWRFALAVLFFALAALLSWSGTRALGKQWRIDAGLTADHRLVTSGPYRWVRHPIYTSMLCVLLATGSLVAPWWLLLPAVVLFLIGTEIRVRIEDRLLASQFGETALEYQRRTGAYIPLLK